MQPSIPYQSIDQIITRHAVERGDKVYAISAETGDAMNYAELSAITNRISHFLAARGIKANERIAVLADNCLSQMALYQGVQRYGATVCLVNCDVNAMNVEQILYDVEPKIVLWHRGLSLELQAIAKASGVENYRFDDLPTAGPENEFFTLIAKLPETRCDKLVGGPNDLTLINYTSGTTSKPKGVCCTNAGYFYATDSVTHGFDITENDRLLEYRALTWCSPQLLSMTSTLLVGASFVLAKKFSVSNFFDWIRKYGVTISAGVPTAITMLLERPHAITQADLPTLRYMTTSSAPIAPETYEAFQKRYGITLLQGSGMSEAGFIFSNDPKAPRRLRIVRENEAGLGHAAALQQRDAVALLESLVSFRGDRRAARGHVAQGRQIGLGDSVRAFEQHRDRGRHPCGNGHAIFPDPVEEIADGEFFRQHKARADQQRRRHREELRRAPGQGPILEQPVVLGNIETMGNRVCRVEIAGVGTAHALGF